MTIKYKIMLFMLPLSVALTQCHTTKKAADTAKVEDGPQLPKPSPLYIPTSANVSSNATLEELVEGRRLVEVKCSNCHKARSASRVSVERWPSVVANMQRRAESSDEKISDADKALIIKYLTSEVRQ
jgi:hypothetical protein